MTSTTRSHAGRLTRGGVLLLCLACSRTDSTPETALLDHPTGKLPSKLSGTGLLDRSGQLSHPAAITYEPRWQLWSNGSSKLRHVVLPGGARIDTSDPADWRYPVGTLFFKTFYFDTRDGRRPVETRLLRGTESGWEMAVYEWNAEGTDALLADISSAKPLELQAGDGRVIRHEIPNRLQCRVCHEASTNFIIGFTELTLGASSPGAPASGSQLEQLHERGLLSHRPEQPAEIEEDTLRSRAIRGYMDVNCAHCHNGRERVDLRHGVFLQNTLNQQTQGFMFPAGWRIRPGRPEESLLYLAFARSQEKGMASVHMPPVGIQEPDTGMIGQLREWIAGLAESEATPLQVPPASAPAPATRPAGAAPGYVPNRHTTSMVNRYSYPLRFERVALSGDHSATRGFTSIRFLPDSDLFLLAEHEGRVSLYQMGEPGASKRGEFRVPEVCANIECGLVSMELDPDFASNSLLYVGYCSGDPTLVKVSRMTLDLERPAGAEASIVDIVEVEASGGHAWHTIGSLLFDRQKALWAMFGDRGLFAPAQEGRSLLGSIIRIQPNRDPQGSGYTVPADNPAPRQDSHPALMAKGLRNPWTAAFDAQGRLWVADVGQGFEEVNLLRPERGFHNFGWPEHDGRCRKDCSGFVNPLISYTRSGDHPYAREDPGTSLVAGQCVWVGPMYNAKRVDRYVGRLENVLLFGDLILGWVRGLTLDVSGEIRKDELLGNMPGITSWSRGPDDFLYVCTFDAYTQDVAAVFRVLLEKSAGGAEASAGRSMTPQ